MDQGGFAAKVFPIKDKGFARRKREKRKGHERPHFSTGMPEKGRTTERGAEKKQLSVY